MKMQGFPRGGSNLKRWPFHLFSISSDQLESQFCVCVCVHCDSMLVYVCVSSWVFICLPVCVSQCEGGIVHVSMYTRVCQRACVCVVVTAAESACPQAGEQLECEFP